MTALRSRWDCAGRVLVVVGAGVLVASCGACSEPANSTNGSGRKDGGAPTDASPDRDAARPDSEASVDAPDDGPPDACGPVARPAAVPEGWEAWTGWSCECPLFLPGPQGEMPAPIEWQPCKEPLPQDIACRQMTHFWNGDGEGINIFPRFSRDASSGAPLLGFTRGYIGGDRQVMYYIVAEPDGPVRWCALQVNGGGCLMEIEALGDSRYLINGLGDTWDGPIFDPDVPVDEGFIAGRIDEPIPSTVHKVPADPSLGSNWSVSAAWIVQRKGIRTAWSWDLKQQHVVYAPSQDPDHLRGLLPTLVGQDVFLQVGDGLPAGVMTWNLAQGIRPLIRWYGDGSRGAGNFATDGTDMVWTYVEGPTDPNGMNDTMSVMTAPHTTFASQVDQQARRVRSDVSSLSPYPWVVGCGHAARNGPANDLFIVRLSDGVSWLLPGKLDLPKRQWDLPLGFTCDEVFTKVALNGSDRIVRIRLDSLGPGTPPD